MRRNVIRILFLAITYCSINHGMPEWTYTTANMLLRNPGLVLLSSSGAAALYTLYTSPKKRSVPPDAPQPSWKSIGTHAATRGSIAYLLLKLAQEGVAAAEREAHTFAGGALLMGPLAWFMTDEYIAENIKSNFVTLWSSFWAGILCSYLTGTALGRGCVKLVS